MTWTTCIVCGEPGPRSRCSAHTTKRPDRDPVRRNNARWKNLSRSVRAASPFCEWCGRTSRLQADHIIPIGERRDLIYRVENLRVLCDRCNGRRQDRVTDDERALVEERLARAEERRRRQQVGREGGDPGVSSPRQGRLSDTLPEAPR